MNDYQLLYLTLVLVYASDCVVFLRERSFLIQKRMLGRQRVRHAANSVATRFGSFMLDSLVPPFDRSIKLSLFPMVLAPEGLIAACPQSFTQESGLDGSLHLVPLEEIHQVSSTAESLLVNGEPFCRFESHHLATHVAGFLDRLVKCPASLRPGMIREFWRNRMDSTAIACLDIKLGARMDRLHAACSLLFVCLFAWIPVLVVIQGLRPAILPAVISLFACVILVLVSWIMVQRNRADVDGGGMLLSALKMFLLPFSAVQSFAEVHRDVYWQFDPLRICLDKGSDGAVARFVASIVRDLKHPMLPAHMRAELRTPVSWHLETILYALEDTGRNGKGNCHLINQEVRKDSVRAVAFCPRCNTQYEHMRLNCPDCQHVQLQSFGYVGDGDT